MLDELRDELRGLLAGIMDRTQQRRALRQLLHERPELRDLVGEEALSRPTYRGKSGGKQRLLHEAGHTGDDCDMRAKSRGASSNRAPWMSWNRGRVEPVTMDLSTATLKFPRAYGAASFYRDAI